MQFGGLIKDIMCAQGIIRAECGVRGKLMGENILWNTSMCMAICSIDFHVFGMVGASRKVRRVQNVGHHFYIRPGSNRIVFLNI